MKIRSALPVYPRPGGPGECGPGREQGSAESRISETLRLFLLSDRFFFITCRVLRRRDTLGEAEFQLLARVLRERRERHGFLLTAWVFLPDHWHAIFFPRFPLTISRLMEAIKVGSTLRINELRKESGLLWQSRFFDRALRTVKEYREKVGYIHQNPVQAGWVRRAEDWPWSSVREYAGTVGGTATRHRVLPFDRVPLPGDQRARI